MLRKYARALRAFGVRKGNRIGVMLPNRIEFPILWFAFANLGAVLVPVNMHYAPREIDYSLNDTQAKFAIVDELAWQVFSAMDPWPEDLPKEQVIHVGAAFRRGRYYSRRTAQGHRGRAVDEGRLPRRPLATNTPRRAFRRAACWRTIIGAWPRTRQSTTMSRTSDTFCGAIFYVSTKIYLLKLY
ncbi:hypothetical protein CWO91_41005 [Bradyrhizobium genosp. SA-3]|uniref:AMP-binding protein n=1 Tax=Bradyrhizobium genosp. SA-3 TaxID=508868 RepID=UPI0010297139|nr:AMP-binding protein [Bradyrhizobium genosp. SA-3]RZM91500.1 hypothetical protein CWO91_41005 [Bradyrhizobium genosp. SA-3]